MESTAAEGRHASWLELFFDLVIVAAAAQLAHLVHEPDAEQVFLFVVFYYAIWSVWTSFTLYANVVGERTRRRTMLFAMFGIAVMAATIPTAAHGHSTAFVIAFLVCRLLAQGTWHSTGTVITSWISAQTSYAFIPWFASLFVHGNAKYALWAVGVVLDVGLSALAARNPKQLLEGAKRQQERRNEQEMRRAAKTRGRSRPRLTLDRLTVARLDPSHLNERLGLFVIIVLGEAVAQVITVAADVPASRALWLVVLAGFGLLVSFWWLTLEYGATAAPMITTLPPQITLPMHFLMTGAIVLVAAGLGAMTEHADAPMPDGIRWVLCAGGAAYFLSIAVIGTAAKAPLVWLFGWSIPAILACLLLGVFGGLVDAWWIAVGLLAVADWHVLYPRITGRPSAAATDSQ